MFFSKFFLSFRTIIEENTSCADGVETFPKLFFTFFYRLTLFEISLVPTWTIKLSGFPLTRKSSWSVFFTSVPRKTYRFYFVGFTKVYCIFSIKSFSWVDTRFFKSSTVQKELSLQFVTFDSQVFQTSFQMIL